MLVLTSRSVCAFLIVMCLAVPSAFALTEQDVQNEASSLQSDLVALRARVNACPRGACSDASAIRADLAALDSSLTQLHGDRVALGSCGCQSLDALIAEDVQRDADIHIIVDDWESTG